MNKVSSSDLQQAKHLASTAHILAIVMLVILAITIAAQVAPPIGNALFSDDTSWRQVIRHIGPILISLLPVTLFYAAINELRRALRFYGEGEFFSSLASTHVAKAGDYAVAAIICTMVVVPNLTLWISRRGGADIRVESELIGMLVLALFVSALGRILAAATQIKAENDSFV